MISAKIKCPKNPDVFRYVCRELTLIKNPLKITEKVKKSYLGYFGVKIGDQDKSRASHVICKGCQVRFIRWHSSASSSFKFGESMTWRESTNCVNDCYFCMVKIVGFIAKNKDLIKYRNIPSTICPVAHSWEVPFPSSSFTSEDMDQHM